MPVTRTYRQPMAKSLKTKIDWWLLPEQMELCIDGMTQNLSLIWTKGVN